MGVALTDSPASIATDRLKFSRRTPGMLTLSAEEKGSAAVLELPGEGDDPETTNFLSGLTSVLNGFADRFASKGQQDDPAVSGAATPPTESAGSKQTSATPEGFDMSALGDMFAKLAEGISADMNSMRDEFRETTDDLAVKVKTIETNQQETPASSYTARPQGKGPSGGRAKTNF